MAKPDKDLFPFPYLTSAEVRITGRFGQGGVAVIHDGDKKLVLKLPPALFAVLAVLVQAAKDQASQGGLAGGFVGVKQLEQEFHRLTRTGTDGLPPDDQQTIKYVFRLRRGLEQAFGGRPRAARARWARQLLESQPFLGYRLSTPPENLHLVIGADGSEGHPNESQP